MQPLADVGLEDCTAIRYPRLRINSRQLREWKDERSNPHTAICPLTSDLHSSSHIQLSLLFIVSPLFSNAYPFHLENFEAGPRCGGSDREEGRGQGSNRSGQSSSVRTWSRSCRSGKEKSHCLCLELRWRRAASPASGQLLGVLVRFWSPTTTSRLPAAEAAWRHAATRAHRCLPRIHQGACDRGVPTNQGLIS